MSFSRQEMIVVLTFVGVFLLGSAVLLLKRAAPEFAEDLIVSSDDSSNGAWADEGPEAGRARAWTGPEDTALTRHLRMVEGELRARGRTATDSLGLPVQKIDLNRASEAELVLLPGIGPKRARAIVDYRAEFGPFGEIADVQRVDGIGPATLARITPWVCLGERAGPGQAECNEVE